MSVLKKKAFIDVLELISGYLHINEKSILVNNEVEMIGTLDEFKALRKGLKVDSPELRDLIYKFEGEINLPITSIEVYNYFRKLTNGFKVDEVKITLKEMFFFRDMVLHERLNLLAKLEYIQNNWEIPTYTKTGKLGTVQFEDFKKMRAKIFPYHGLLFYEVFNLLERKLIVENEKQLHSETEILDTQQKTLSDLITHQKNIEIVDAIKNRYKNIKGKRLKLLLIALQDLALIPKERIGKEFHNCCKKEFKWNIASYNAMNGYSYNKSYDSKEVTEIKEYLEKVINSK